MNIERIRPVVKRQKKSQVVAPQTVPPKTPPNMGSFPTDAADFMSAIEDLFRHKYKVFVLEHDDNDDTFLIQWTDRTGRVRKSWVTDTAMEELSAKWTMN